MDPRDRDESSGLVGDVVRVRVVGPTVEQPDVVALLEEGIAGLELRRRDLVCDRVKRARAPRDASRPTHRNVAGAVGAVTEVVARLAVGNRAVHPRLGAREHGVACDRKRARRSQQREREDQQRQGRQEPESGPCGLQLCAHHVLPSLSVVAGVACSRSSARGCYRLGRG